jgi:hypothetical protein
MSAGSTKKGKAAQFNDLRAEYRREELGVGVRGKYYKRFQAGSNVVLLAPDVARFFRTSESVNDALRSLIGVAERTTRLTTRSARSSGSRAASSKAR